MTIWRNLSDAPINTYVIVACKSGYIGREWVYLTARQRPESPYTWVNHANNPLSDSGLVPSFWREILDDPVDINEVLKEVKEKQFAAVHIITKKVTSFTENDAPDWLTSANTVKGSTMDMRWFWKEHILKLEVDQSISTDFHIIKRVL